MIHHGRSDATHDTTHTATSGRLIHWAKRYDLLIQTLTFGRERQLRGAIADLAAIKPGESVLDVGCGTGTLAQVIAERVGHEGKVAGVDPSPEMIARARMKAKKRAQAIDFRLESAEALSFADQSFDVVVSSFAVHHLPGGVAERVLGEIARVLKPAGRICLVDFLPTGNQQGMQASTASGYKPVAEVLASLGFEQIATGKVRVPLLPGLASVGYITAHRP